jgi:hypothetical protein
MIRRNFQRVSSGASSSDRYSRAWEYETRLSYTSSLMENLNLMRLGCLSTSSLNSWIISVNVAVSREPSLLGGSLKDLPMMSSGSIVGQSLPSSSFLSYGDCRMKGGLVGVTGLPEVSSGCSEVVVDELPEALGSLSVGSGGSGGGGFLDSLSARKFLPVITSPSFPAQILLRKTTFCGAEEVSSL